MTPDRERMPGRATRERAKWFASMAACSAYYARIAERTKCEAFCQVRARDFTFHGKKAEAVFRRWATR